MSQDGYDVVPGLERQRLFVAVRHPIKRSFKLLHLSYVNLIEPQVSKRLAPMVRKNRPLLRQRAWLVQLSHAPFRPISPEKPFLERWYLLLRRWVSGRLKYPNNVVFLRPQGSPLFVDSGGTRNSLGGPVG